MPSPLIVSEFVSVDGVVEAPGGEPTHPHAGWALEFAGEEQMQYKLREVQEAGSLLLGRVTYDGFAAAWPERDGVFADKMNAMPKHVVTSTRTTPLEWNNSTVITGDVVTAVRALTDQDGAPILVAGSATLVAFLIEHDLVDELRLMVFPVVLGGGKRCFPDSRTKHTLRLSGTETFPSGVAVHTYAPA
jgi:dihydrofolate reductase